MCSTEQRNKIKYPFPLRRVCGKSEINFKQPERSKENKKMFQNLKPQKDKTHLISYLKYTPI